ncbi:MAG: hypothetical protein HXS54_05900 [Theionarchaea archaeon]|nr:hypothetical protein [Theionarchaea archaeon]
MYGGFPFSNEGYIYLKFSEKLSRFDHVQIKDIDEFEGEKLDLNNETGRCVLMLVEDAPDTTLYYLCKYTKERW